MLKRSDWKLLKENMTAKWQETLDKRECCNAFQGISTGRKWRNGLVELVQHLIVKPYFIATTMVVDHNSLRQQYNQEQTTQNIAQHLAVHHETEIQ
jgi:hypothetical protein